MIENLLKGVCVLGKFVKVIKSVFAIALIAFLAALFLRVCQSDYKGLEDVNITNDFILAYKQDSDVRTHAVNDTFSENGGVYAYSLVYMKEAGYLQLTVRYNTRHTDAVKERYPEFTEDQIRYTLTDSNGKTYTPKVVDSERRYNYQYYKLEFTDIESFDRNLTVNMIFDVDDSVDDKLNEQSTLVVHRAKDTSVAYKFSRSEAKLLKK